MMRATNVIFVRHAESFNNSLYQHIYDTYGSDISEERFQMEEERLRQSDPDLSTKGYQQAQALGK